MLEISEWQHSCDESDLPEEFLEMDGLGCVIDGLDPIIGNPSDSAVDWAIGTGEKRLGGGYFRYCPYCGANLPQNHNEAMAMYQAEAVDPAPISTKVGG